MEKKLIPILIILLAALLFTSSCTGVYTTSLPVAVSPSPVPAVSPAPTATTSPRVTPSPSPSPTPTPPPYEGELIAQYAKLEDKGLVENSELFAKYLIVERNVDDVNRIDVLLPPDVVNQLRIFAMQVQFRLQFDEE